MIFDRSTVLVLGAGASKPYGFPLGDELKQRIIELCSNAGTAECKQFLEAGYREDEIRDFRADLIRSINPIMDAFLEDRPSHRGIGAFAVAHILMRLEDEQVLYPHRDWYEMLFRELNLKEANRDSHVIGIVTFNYDRSLEHYLSETTKRTLEGQRRDEALAKLSRIPIVHVHGILGSYPDMPYRPQRTTDDIKRGAAGISMVHEVHLDSAEEFKHARALIKEAHEVVFLGFGYDQRSLTRLDILENNTPPVVFGTAYQLSPERHERVKGMFHDKIQLGPGHFGIKDYLPGLHKA